METLIDEMGGQVRVELQMRWLGEYGSSSEVESVGSSRMKIELVDSTLVSIQRRRKNAAEGKGFEFVTVTFS